MSVGELVVQGGEQARPLVFEELFEEYHDAIYNYILRTMGNPEDAADLTQETFLRAYQALPRMGADLRVAPWLYRIATNACLDELRRRKLVRWEPLENFLALFHPKQTASDDPEREAIEQEDRQLVEQVLAKLSPRHRLCLILREYQDLSCQEIAEVLGTSRQAVKSLLFRAREEFRTQMAALEAARLAQVQRREV